MGKSSDMSIILVKGLSVAGYSAVINVIPEGGGGRPPWDRVGTLIKNKYLGSNLPTLGMRFQFKFPHRGIRF